MPRIYVSLDIETTGLQAERDAIIEIGAVKFRGDEIISEWSSLVNPQRPIPHKIERLTGIMDAEAQNAPSFYYVLPQLKRFIGENPLVGHNIKFDLAFLQRAGFTTPPPALDTFDLACILMPYASRYSLGKLMEALAIEFPTRHRALEDARATSQLFNALLDRAGRLDQKVIQEISKFGDKSDWPLKYAFQDILRDLSRTAFAPGTIGAQLAGKNFATKDETLGLLFSRDREERPLKPNTMTAPLDVDALAHMLGPNGKFSEQFAGYEHRPQQIDMVRSVAQAFNDSATLLVEAGTGTGKSVAYLVPSLYWAAQNNQRVVISTNTINLQDQLILKDVPDLRKVLPFEFRAVILKGRANYICRRRLDSMRKEAKLSVDEIKVLAKVLAWLPSTATGDMAELVLMGPAENAVWARIASDSDHCSADQCSVAQEGNCFFYRARKKAESAHVIIVNHALLLSDVAADNRVLPEYKYLVVDEAHHIEAQATSALSFEASSQSLELMLRGLAHARGGLIGNLAGALKNSDVPRNQKDDAQAIFNDVALDVDRAIQGVYDFFNSLDKFIEKQEQLPGEDGGYDRQIRLTQSRRAQPEWSGIEICWDDFGARLMKMRDGIEKIYNVWSELDDFEIPSYFDLLQELAAAMRRLGETRAAMESLITKPQANGIYWVSINKNNGNIAVHVAPLHVGELLQKKLFSDKEAVILTSATLRVGNDFSYIKTRLGIGDWSDEYSVGSPFDYKAAAMVYVPSDMPEPGQQGYQKTVETTLIELLKATQGRTLVLFTSHSQLQTTYRAITRPLEEDGIIVIAQNLDGGRRQVLETFKTQERTVLLGTRSFWEGVDIAGEALSCLVITRLPFSVPSDPIFAARSETFDDSFGQYAVPEAVLRFRQGFGRLIRTKTDRGIVVILDKRVVTKNYGRTFVESLPPVSKQQGTLKELPKVAEKWLGAE